MIRKQLRHDPYKNFMASITPVGLFTRQKWIGQEKDVDWRDALDICVDSFLEGLSKTRDNSGTWGDTEKEWNTFIAVHALRNKKL